MCTMRAECRGPYKCNMGAKGLPLRVWGRAVGRGFDRPMLKDGGRGGWGLIWTPTHQLTHHMINDNDDNIYIHINYYFCSVSLAPIIQLVSFSWKENYTMMIRGKGLPVVVEAHRDALQRHRHPGA